jgi:riboflavin synthase
MFTGIIDQRGKVSGLTQRGSSLVVAAPGLSTVPIGSSVSVSGVCLTVVGSIDDGARFDVIPETLSRTNLGGLEVGDEVNLELAMPADGRFDGHIVQGHVDGTGRVLDLVRDGAGVVLVLEPPPDLMEQIVEKGSITIDGVSLTVSAATESTFEVSLIPHTLEVTTLGSLRPGDTVNLETDVLAKYVQRILKAVR